MATIFPTLPRPSAIKMVTCSSSVPSKDNTKWKMSPPKPKPVVAERASSFSHYEADFAHYLSREWKEKGLANKYYKAALRREVGDDVALVRAEYAEFAWKEMGEFETAEEMFGRAVDEAAAPLDALLAGRYAHFMWITSED